jgi:predicted Fe-Mo cluster-binding NifX family protein
MAALAAAGIEVYTGISGTVSECLADYRQGRLTPVSRPPRWG